MVQISSSCVNVKFYSGWATAGIGLHWEENISLIIVGALVGSSGQFYLTCVRQWIDHLSVLF